MAQRSRPRFLLGGGLAVSGVLVGLGCNALWGVDDLSFARDQGGNGGATLSGGAGGVGAAGAGGAGSGGSTSGGAGGEGGATPCEPLAIESCYTGPIATDGVPPCHPGTRQCLADGSDWGPCEGEQLPGTEICANGIDEDCSGADATLTACLDSGALVVRYFIDEAADGQGPSWLIDAAPDPLPLTLEWGAGFTYCGAASTRALCWTNAAAGTSARGAIANSKLRAALDGATAITLEIVAAPSFVDAPVRLLSISTDSPTDLGFSCAYDGSVVVGWHGSTALAVWEGGCEEGVRRVFHVVIDTNAAVADDRTRLYVDGALATLTGGGGADLGEPITLSATPDLVLGNTYGGTTPAEGALNYLAIYATAFGADQVGLNAAILQQADDAPTR